MRSIKIWSQIDKHPKCSSCKTVVERQLLFFFKLYSYVVQTSSFFTQTPAWAARARRTGESSEHGGGDDGFALLQRLVPLLDVVFKGQALFAEAQRSHAELLLEAVVGRDALGIGERRVAPPGAEDGLGAVCALHALHRGHCEEQSNTRSRTAPQTSITYQFLAAHRFLGGEKGV